MEADIMELQVQSLTKFFIIITFFFVSCKEKNSSLPKYDIDKITLTRKQGESFYNQKKFNGILFQTLFENDTKLLGKYVNGKKHGVWKKFYENGNLKEIRSYNNGIKYGKHTGYYNNGRKQFEYNLKNDEYHGLKRAWNKEGIMIQKMNFLRGYENGFQKVWYDNGTIKSNYYVKNGRRFGLLGTKNCTNVKDSIF